MKQNSNYRTLSSLLLSSSPLSIYTACKKENQAGISIFLHYYHYHLVISPFRYLPLSLRVCLLIGSIHSFYPLFLLVPFLLVILFIILILILFLSFLFLFFFNRSYSYFFTVRTIDGNNNDDNSYYNNTWSQNNRGTNTSASETEPVSLSSKVTS